MKMKLQYTVMEVKGRNENDREVSQHDTEREAVERIEQTPADLMGTVKYYIRPTYTNAN